MPTRAFLQSLSWISSDIDHRALPTALTAERRKTFFRLLWPSLMTHVSDRTAAILITEAPLITLATKTSKISLRELWLTLRTQESGCRGDTVRQAIEENLRLP